MYASSRNVKIRIIEQPFSCLTPWVHAIGEVAACFLREGKPSKLLHRYRSQKCLCSWHFVCLSLRFFLLMNCLLISIVTCNSLFKNLFNLFILQGNQLLACHINCKYYSSILNFYYYKLGILTKFMEDAHDKKKATYGFQFFSPN